MKQTFYSNGKLLITGEYLVLDGAKAFALPTKFGQNLIIEEAEGQIIHWKSVDSDGSIWFEDTIPFLSIVRKERFDDAKNIKNTLIEILHRGDEHRSGIQQEQSARALDRYGLAGASEQKFESLSGGQQARFQILLLELSGATLLLLDEPTDNLDLESAESLERALDAFEGTVLAVTHDRWFSRTMDRFVIFGADSTVRESDEPVWDEKRAKR